MTVAINVVVAVVVIALVAGFALFRELPRRRWEQPLREEMRTRPVTFQASVAVKVGAVDPMDSQRGPFYLSEHGDAFEVATVFPPFRLLNGQDYCYRAQDTTVEVARGVLHDWIEICGHPRSGAVRIRIGRMKMNRQLWDVLVNAGAHPIGPPPAL
jgi:hypothetical protein